jgi:hypothetical protein
VIGVKDDLLVVSRIPVFDDLHYGLAVGEWLLAEAAHVALSLLLLLISHGLFLRNTGLVSRRELSAAIRSELVLTLLPVG